MKISLKKFYFPDWSVPLALVLVCLVSYGLLLRDLGFYWDDWPSVWFQYTGGGAIFKEVFASDRPLLGRLFMLTMPVFRSSIIGWQLFGIFTRALASISLWGLLVCVFPKRRNEAAWTALLFAVYPGFMQQWIAVTYSHAFIAYAVFFVSMLFMVLAFRKPRWFWLFMGLSYLTSLWTMFAVDVYTGLEVIRPLLLWVVLSEKPEFNQKPLVERIKSTLLYFLPYVGMMVLFVIWRVFLLAFPRGTLQLPNAGNAVSTNPFIAILQMVSSILQDLVVVTFGAWGRIFPFANPAALPAEYWWVVILVFVLLALYLSKLSSTPSADDQPAFQFASLNLSWGWLLVGTGCLTLLAGGWAYWIINLPFRLVFPYDRTSLPMFLGVSLLITGLMEILLRSRLQKIILLSLLVALAAGSHLLNAAEYVKDYQDQKDFFWQLSWRIPGIQPGTTLLTNTWNFKYDTDNSLSAPLNFIYAPREAASLMRNLIVYLPSRIGLGFPGVQDEETGHVSVPPNQPFTITYRAARFEGNTSQVVVFYYQPPACLRILDPQVDAHISLYPERLYDILPLSNVDLISTTNGKANKLPVGLFGKEPKSDWCNYYQEADLARQHKDWQKVVEIGKTAMDEHHLKPRSPLEYLPFIEGNARSAQWEQAQTLTAQAALSSHALQPTLCYLWSQLKKSEPVPEKVMESVNQSSGCQP